MSESTIGRRQMLRGAGIAAGGAAVTGLGMASPAMASDDGHGLTGSWLITHQDDPPGDPTEVLAVASLAAGGVLIVHDINPVTPPGAGTWESRGDRRFRGTFWAGFVGGPEQVPLTARVRVRGRVEHDTISGTHSVTIFDAGSGAEVDSGTGTFRGHRIDA